tara:strand:+ start:8 stop:763 length:756 start_codon:yes stop_codon:yes gene_type:complete
MRSPHAIKGSELQRHPSMAGGDRTGLAVLEGWLLKHNRTLRKKRCYFRTHNHHLLYYKTEPADDDVQPAGAWDLWTVDTVDIDSHDSSGRTIRITFAEGKRAHRLECDSAGMAQDWARELRLRRDNVIRHSHDHLRRGGEGGAASDGAERDDAPSASRHDGDDDAAAAAAATSALGDDGEPISLSPDAARAVSAIDRKLRVSDGELIPYLTDADCRDRPAQRYMNPSERRALLATRAQIVKMEALLRASET